MLLEAAQSQLVLIDYQGRLMPAMADGTNALANALRLARMAQAMRVPLWVTEQNPERLGPTDEALRAASVDAQARFLSKMVFSAVPAGLAEALRTPAQRPGARAGNARSLPRHLQKPEPAAPERESIVLAGCEAHVCLLQTALELLDQEFDVWVVTDACASRSERNRDAAFDRLAGNGAELVTTEMVAFEWLRGAEHPQFKAVQAMIK
jgi:nicotinamidase-related amidase